MRSRRHQSLDLAWASLRHAQGRMLGLPFIATAIAPGLLFGWPVCIAALTVASVASFLIYMPLTALALNSGASLTEDGPLHGVGPATFLFATEDGTISGWNKAAGGESVIAVNESANPADGSESLGMGAVYKGLAIAQTHDGPMLYAANFRHRTVDMFDQNFNQVKSFTDSG